MRYLVAVIVCMISVSVFSQTSFLSEDFESYTVGEYIGEASEYFTTWSGTTGGDEDGQVSDEQANSGSQSLKIYGDMTGGGPMDIYLPIGLETAYEVSFNMYVPTGYSAYFNIQEQLLQGTAWAFEVVLTSAGEVICSVDQTIISTGSYTLNEWTTISLRMDPINDRAEIKIEGDAIANIEFDGIIGGLNFYGYGDAVSEGLYYVDDVFITETDVVFPWGCTDTFACNYNHDSNTDDGSCYFCGEGCAEPEEAVAYTLTVESATSQYVVGHTVYRFYVDMTDVTDRMSAVFGNNQDPLIINTPSGIYNSVYNNCNINPAFWPSFPETQDDSYISIGDIPCADCYLGDIFWNDFDCYVCQELIDYFTIGGTSLLINTLTGCSAYILNTSSAGLPIDGRVFIMQITTSGSISGTLNYQVFPLGVGADQVQISVDFDGAGTFGDGSIENACGCMDDAACNYDSSAEYNDESCIYAEVLYDCNGECINDANGDGICDSICPEDLDSDGYITIQDLLLILSDFGCDTLCENDITQDGYVAVDDLLQVLSEFGNSCE